MATSYSKQNDHCLGRSQCERLHQLVLKSGLTVTTLAYELRMSRTHVSCMLSHNLPMARVHKLAIQWVLLMRDVEKRRAARVGIDEKAG